MIADELKIVTTDGSNGYEQWLKVLADEFKVVTTDGSNGYKQPTAIPVATVFLNHF